MDARRRIFLSLAMSAILVVSTLTFTGCSKVNQENYNRLKVGMSYNEVVAILGQAEECGSAINLKNCTWGSEKKSVNIQFAGDKVVFFSAKGLK